MIFTNPQGFPHSLFLPFSIIFNLWRDTGWITGKAYRHVKSERRNSTSGSLRSSWQFIKKKTGPGAVDRKAEPGTGDLRAGDFQNKSCNSGKRHGGGINRYGQPAVFSGNFIILSASGGTAGAGILPVRVGLWEAARRIRSHHPQPEPHNKKSATDTEEYADAPIRVLPGWV